MARQALYRVYRPRRFSEVVGQSRSIQVLQAAVVQERLTHAYCFSGPRGTGKTSVARLLAKAVNCLNRSQDGEPCLNCASCQAMDQGAHLDIIEIDAASNRGIDEIREIRERVAHLPVIGRTKVYIIDEVHMLTNDAFNALLKTLEEPPAHVMFILATTEVHKVPLTVLSRCQRYQFSRLDAFTIQKRLEQVLDAEGQGYEPHALAIIADSADGALRDALSLTDQILAMAHDQGLAEATVREFLGGLDQSLLEQLLIALTESSLKPLLSGLQMIWQEGRDVRQMLRDVAQGLRDLMLYRTLGEEALASYRRDFYRALSDRLPATIAKEAWFQAMEALADGEGRLRGGFPPRLVAEMALFKVHQDLTSAMAESERPVATKPLAISSVEPDVGPRVAVEPPRDPPARAATTAPSASTEASARFNQVLEQVREERPSTYALLQYAEVFEENARVVIWFQFPAHRDIIASAPHREVLARVFSRVYGSEIGYDLRAGETEKPSFSAGPKESEVNRADPEAISARLQEVFGAPIQLSLGSLDEDGVKER